MLDTERIHEPCRHARRISEATADIQWRCGIRLLACCGRQRNHEQLSGMQESRDGRHRLKRKDGAWTGAVEEPVEALTASRGSHGTCGYTERKHTDCSTITSTGALPSPGMRAGHSHLSSCRGAHGEFCSQRHVSRSRMASGPGGVKKPPRYSMGPAHQCIQPMRSASSRTKLLSRSRQAVVVGRSVHRR